MALDLDPVYHTETMVKILREQGSTLTAMELCEKILENNPGHEGVRKILTELKAEARASFDRFRGSGSSEQPKASVEVAAVPTKIQKLEALLTQVQEYRRSSGA